MAAGLRQGKRKVTSCEQEVAILLSLQVEGRRITVFTG
jgi:hypothetical protein